MEPTKNAIDVGIVTANPGAMISFYLDVVGLKYDRMLKTRIGTVHRLGFGRSWLKLLEASPATATLSNAHTEITAGTGIRYLTLEVDDIETVWEHVLHSKADVLVPLERDRSLPVSTAMLFDPDGNVIEFLQRHE